MWISGSLSDVKTRPDPVPAPQQHLSTPQSFLLLFHSTHSLLCSVFAFSLMLRERNHASHHLQQFFWHIFLQLETPLLLHMSGWACCIMTRGMPVRACVCVRVYTCLSYFLCKLCNHLLKCSVFTWLSTFQINIIKAVQTAPSVKSSLECYWHTQKDPIQILFCFHNPLLAFCR